METKTQIRIDLGKFKTIHAALRKARARTGEEVQIIESKGTQMVLARRRECGGYPAVRTPTEVFVAQIGR